MIEFDSNAVGANQVDLYFKCNTGLSSFMFANSSIFGMGVQSGQVFHIYGTGGVAFEISSAGNSVTIPGTLNVQGTKNFEIKHPDPAKTADEGKEWRLKHTCIESDKPYLWYRTRVNMTATTQTFAMPSSWFPHIAAEPWVHATPHRHFGSAWGEIADDGFTFTLHASTLGEWNVSISALRDDPLGQAAVAEPIEFQKDLPIPNYVTNPY